MSSTSSTTPRQSLTERDAISCDADVVSGTPVFRGTRVPVTTLFDYLMHDKSVSAFYDDFPTVGSDQVMAVLRSARDHVSKPIFPRRVS